MARGEFFLRRQIGGRGAFARVAVEMEELKTNDFDVRIDLNPSDMSVREFEAAAELGVRYAWERIDSFHRPPGATVTVTELTISLVDTTQIQVVYAAAMAMLKVERERAREEFEKKYGGKG